MNTGSLGSVSMAYPPGGEPRGKREWIWPAWLMLTAGAVLLLAVVVMAFARRAVPLPSVRDSEPWYSGVFNALGTAVLLTTGGYLALRLPRNPLAWLMLVAGFGYSLHLFAVAYTYTSYLVAPQPLPLTAAMFVLAAVGLALVLPTLAMLVLLFPSGQLPSPRWRFAYGVWLYSVFVMGGFSWLSPTGKWVPFDNPIALQGGVGQTLGALSVTAWFSFLILLALATLSAVVRGLRATGLERQQFKWLVLAGLWVSMAALVASGATGVWFYFVNMLSTAAIPLAIAMAVARYRLWDLDVLIRRTTAYALLTGALTLVYFGSVVVLQHLLSPLTGESTPAVVLSTLLIAALFLPLRRRIQEIIDRHFFRRKYDAEQVLARFATTARDETDLDALVAELAWVIQETMQPEQVSVWLRPVNEKRTWASADALRDDTPRAAGRSG